MKDPSAWHKSNRSEARENFFHSSRLSGVSIEANAPANRFHIWSECLHRLILAVPQRIL
jgi:hypothetical protein